MIFKTVSLDEKKWRAICALIDQSQVEEDHQLAQMIREQIDGDLIVKVTRGSVSFKAKKGGDVHNSLSMPRPGHQLSDSPA